MSIDIDAIEKKYPWLERAVQLARDGVAAMEPAENERRRNADRERRSGHLLGLRLPLEEHVTRQIIDGALERTPSWVAVSRVVNAVLAGHATRKMLGLLGDAGRGKTTACAAAIAELGGTYIRFDELVGLYCLAKKNKGEKAELRSILDSRVLVVDEVQLSSPRIEERVDARLAFHAVVDRRIGMRGVTLIASNRSEEELKEAFDDVTFDRLGALWEVVRNEGDSFRQRRPWRVVLTGGRGTWNIPSPLPKLTKEQASELRADVRAREARLRTYYEAKAYADEERLTVLVELSSAVYMALAEIRAAEGAG